jgi:hypothetical protein
MEIIPSLRSGSLVVVYAGHAARDEISHVISQLALRGPLTVLDGGNRLQACRIGQLLRQHTTEIHSAAEHLFIRRAFTCYQMLALLAQSSEVPIPTLVLDLIATFLDESVALIERRYLLRQATDHLLRLSQQAPVAVSSSPLTADQPGDLLQALVETADHIVRFEEPPPPHTQLRLL